MPDEYTNNEPKEPICYSASDYLLYKMDRTIAILGVIAIAIYAMMVLVPEAATQIASAGIGGLIGYVGGRTGK